MPISLPLVVVANATLRENVAHSKFKFVRKISSHFGMKCSYEKFIFIVFGLVE